MPEYEKHQISSKPPFSADIVIRQESHTVTPIRENGYNGNPVNVEGGILLNIKLSASGLPELKKKLEGHIALVE